MKNLHTLLKYTIYGCSLPGMYIIIDSVLCEIGGRAYLPYIGAFVTDFGFYSMLIGLPVASIFAFFQRDRRSKILGFIFFVFFIIGLVLIDQALQ
jgi:hypothetical protein